MADIYQDEIDVLAGVDQNSPEQENEKIATLLSEVVSQLDTQERITRDRMLRLWKYLELLWSGSGNYYWDHSTGAWAAITQEDISLLAQEADIDPTLINKTINLIRPYGESLAGVLTTGMPRVRYYPADADNDLDIQASRGYTDIEKKINDDNLMPMKLIEILIKLWNGGFAAAYNYTHTDVRYGTYSQPVMGDRQFDQQSLICTECGNEQIQESEMPEQEQSYGDTEEEAPETDLSPDEMQQPDLEVEMPEMGMPEVVPAFCPECQMDLPHIATNQPVTKNVEVGTEDMPKSRQIINIFGPMNVKISALAVREEHIFWLILEEDIDVALAKYLYPEHRDKITPSTSSQLDIDRLSRAPLEVAEETLRETATIRKVWLKPAAFEKLNPADADMLKAKYPNGIKCLFCADTYLEAEEENLDDHWTISVNPLYNRILADPLGKAIIGCHEVGNDLFQLEVDAVRHAIPITFADPKSLDFVAFGQTRSLPGSIYPMKKPAGGSLSEALAEVKTSTLPQGIEYLDAKVEKLIQFISGVLPSVFGGPVAGSKTLGEYQESRNQALQRLSIIWKVVSVMYAKMMAKTTKQYADNLRQDEKYVRPNGKDGFMNVWLRREVFQSGKVGEVQAEVSEQFPMTWAQISARVMELLGMNNEVIMSWFLHPENVELIYKVLGIDGMHIPGEDQRNKQLYEIGEIIQASQPIQDPITGQLMPAQLIQFPVEPIDNHQLHMEVIAAWLNSPMGIDLRNTNPIAYQNLIDHYQLHAGEFAIQQQMQAEQEAKMNPKQESNGDKPVKETANA